jgi:hypothetical protein|tara:strand:+ start:1974 stop:2261 length:288 start_codon:yes stop_codon:yes gene_type:complete
MIDVGSAQTGFVSVVTSDNKGLDAEHWAERATDRIVSVGGNCHPAIKDQAEAFKDQVNKVVMFYMEQAIKSDRTTLIALLEKNQNKDVAEIIRRL